MTSDEIRERFLAYFAEHGHERLPSAPLVPRSDPSTLLISAGMHPLKPYFLGAERPPADRLTTARSASARSTSTTSAAPTAT
jgi:alanyl-tRNA synthetase